MKEFKINFVGNDEEIKKEDILNDFDFNYLPINNLPVSYFPLNNGLLSNELKKINKEELTSGEALGSSEFNSTSFELSINALNSPYTILVKKNINCKLNLSGTWKNIRLNKGIYTIISNFNKYNIIEKNKKEIYKDLTTAQTDIILNFIDNSNSDNVKKISSNNIKGIDLNISSGHSLETLTDNPNYKLIKFSSGSNNTLKLNKDITCDILVVGGGGSGGWLGGGGGGGGVVEKENFILKSGSYIISIGEGGIGWRSRTAGNTTISLNSSNILAAGGGGNGQSVGIDEDTNGTLITYGGESNSGGGGGSANSNTNGTGSLSGKGISGNGGTSPSDDIYSSGGGGGAYGNGYSGNKHRGGNGGNGKLSKITNLKYGGGGGGAYVFKIGGIGIDGGGNGGSVQDVTNVNTGLNGEVNTGGGGGGVTKIGGGVGHGGSGIVIIRVKKEDIENDVNNDEILTSTDTRIINEINNLLEKKMIEFNNYEKPYNYLGIYPLVILIIIFWIFIFLFLLKFVHHYFVSIYLYILIFIIIFLLIFGSLWFLYTNNDLL